MFLKKLLVFHPALAPYRIDLFNSLHEHFLADFYFFRINLISKQFDIEKIKQQLNFTPKFLIKGFEFTSANRLIRFGYLKKITEHKPDLILCSEYGPITILIICYSKLFYPKAKLFTLCDDSLVIAKNCSFFRKIARAICLKLLDGLILGNDEVKPWFKTHFPTIPVVVIPIIQKESRLINFLPQSALITEKYNSKYNLADKNVLLFVGRLTAVKNLIFLIDVFASYVQTNSNSILILVGDGDQKMELSQMINSHKMTDYILLPGSFENEALYAWYNIADYFILPSIYEPFGAVVNEALIFGVPVLCSSLAGAASLINTNNGLLFYPENKPALLSLLAITLGRGHKNERSKFSPKSLMPFSFDNRIVELIDFLNRIN